MNRLRRNRSGYTILEVIIVLTVSSLLFAAALIGYNTQNRRTQFTESVNNFAQDIQDVLNDVETGTYPSNNSSKCTAPAGAGAPDPNQPGPVEQGSNTDCTFLGKALQFAPQGTSRASVDIYTVVGRRLTPAPNPEPVVNINEASPVASTSLVDRKTLSASLEIVSVKQANTGSNLAGFAMVSTSTSTSSNISTGLNARASLAVIPGSIDLASSSFIASVTGINSTSINEAKGGITICLREGGGANDRYAMLDLATERSQIIVNIRVDIPVCT